MPFYSYQCDPCGEQFDAQSAVAERDSPRTCPCCGGDARRVFTPCALRMPHSDWCEMTAWDFLDCKKEREARSRVTVTKGAGKVAPRL